jgi:hypothetical protein
MKEVSVNLSGLTTGIGGSSILTNGGSAGGLTPPKRSERADSACAMLPGDNPTLNDLIGQLTSPDSTTSTYVDKRGSDLGPTPPTNEDLDSAYESYCESVENETTTPSHRHDESEAKLQSDDPAWPSDLAPPKRSATMDMKRQKLEEWHEACKNHKKHLEWFNHNCDLREEGVEGKDGEIPEGMRWSYPCAGKDIRPSLNFWRRLQTKAAELKAAREGAESRL